MARASRETIPEAFVDGTELERYAAHERPLADQLFADRQALQSSPSSLIDSKLLRVEGSDPFKCGRLHIRFWPLVFKIA